MQELSPKQKRVLEVLAKVDDGGMLALTDIILELEAEIERIEAVKPEKGDKGDRGEVGPRGESIFGPEGPQGPRGLDAEKPTADELRSIIHPLIPEPRHGKDGLDGKDGSPDTADQVRDKLESLKEDNRLDASAIKGLGKREKKMSDDLVNRAIGIVDQRTSFLINKVSNLQDQVNRIPTNGGGAVDSVNGQTGVVVLDTGDITEAVDANYVTDAQLVVISNTSGTNTGDVTVSDTSEIGLTLTGQQLSASIVAGSIDETKLDTSVNASLDLADSALQGNQSITLSGEAGGTGATAITVTLANSAVIGKVLTGYTSGAGTVAATDTILQAIQKLNGNTAALVTGVSSVNSATGAVTLTVSNTGVNGTLGWDGTALEIPQADTDTTGLLSDTDWDTFNGKQAAGNYITALTGDVTATGPGSVAATLATVNANVGSFGSSTSIPSFTVNAKGLITAASGNDVIAPAGTLTGATLASNVLASSLTSVGTLTGGATGAGFTIALGTSTLTGDLPFANLTQIAGLSVLGRSANTTGDVAGITGTDGQVLRVSGTTLGFGTVATAGIADDAVTYAKLQNVSATSRLLGRYTASAGNAEEIALNTGIQVTGGTLKVIEGYFQDDEAAASLRQHQFVAPTDYLNSAPSVTWASYTGFVTPTSDATSFPSIWALYKSGGTAGSTRMFGYNVGAAVGGMAALVAAGIANCRVGVRLDDGTNDNYVELFLEAQSGASTGLVKLRYRTATAGTPSGPTDLWNGGTFVSEFMWLKIAQGGGAWYAYAGKNNIYQPVLTAAAIGWTPTRIGVYAEHPDGGALDVQSAALFDALTY